MTWPDPQAWRTVLIVEDDSDGRALRRLAERCHLPVHLDWLPANGIGNIKRKGQALIRLARDRLESEGGCVAVVVDRDGHDASRDEPHRTIARMCQDNAVPYIEAVEPFESWCLAQDGIAAWLGVAQRTQTDTIRDPRKVVAQAFYRKTKRPYQKRRARVQLAEKATGVPPGRSASWTKALGHLYGCLVPGTAQAYPCQEG